MKICTPACNPKLVCESFSTRNIGVAVGAIRFAREKWYGSGL